MQPLTTLLGNSTLHKVAGLVGAALAAVLGPGINSDAHIAFAAISALYAAVVHGIDSAWNSAPAANPAGKDPAA